MNKDVSINGDLVFVKSGNDYRPLTVQALGSWLRANPEVITGLNIGFTFDLALASQTV